MKVPHAAIRWRKSSRSTGSDTCVELAYDGLVRDSKNPSGPALNAALAGFIAAVKGDLAR